MEAAAVVTFVPGAYCVEEWKSRLGPREKVGEVVLGEVDEQDWDLVLALEELLRCLLELFAHLVAPPELLLCR